MDGKFLALKTAADYSTMIGFHRFKQVTFSWGEFIRPDALDSLDRYSSKINGSAEPICRADFRIERLNRRPMAQARRP